MVGRVELLVHLRVGVVGAAVLPFGEPQFLGGVVHRALVEDTGVVDDALEPVRPVAGDPVLHEAAIGCAERTGACAVQPVVSGERGIEAFLQIDERFAAPILADGIGERLTVAGRTVEIDEHDAVARARIDLRVPAP